MSSNVILIFILSLSPGGLVEIHLSWRLLFQSCLAKRTALEYINESTIRNLSPLVNYFQECIHLIKNRSAAKICVAVMYSNTCFHVCSSWSGNK